VVTGPVQVGAGDAPVITGAPTISGTVEVDETLTASAASVTGDPTPTRAWQWLRAGVAIIGATSATYTVVEADIGARLSVRQTETNVFGADTATSAETIIVPSLPEEVAAPELSAVSFSAPGGPLAVSTTVGEGTIYLRAQSSADAAPDVADVIAGGGLAATSASVTASGAQSIAFDLSAFAPGSYQIYIVHRRAGVIATWVDSARAQLPAAFEIENPAATLTSLAMPDVDGPATVSTDVGAGTIYLRAQPSADAAPEVADVIAGGGTVSSNQAVVGTGAQSIPLDLTAAADGSYQVYGVHRRAGLFTAWVDSARVQLAAPFVKSAAWSPAALFGSGEPGAWYEPRLTSSFTDTARTTAAVENDVIAGMTDLSGNGNHLSQATLGARPALRLAGGKYYLEMDGVDDVLFGALTTQLVGPWEFWAAVNITAGAGIGLGLFTKTASSSGGSSQTNVEGLFQRSDGSTRAILSASRIGSGTGNSANLSSAFTLNTPFWARAVAEPTQVRATTAAGSATVAAAYTGTPGSSAFRIGHGAASAAFRFYGGVAIDRELTAGEATSLQAYMEALYA
jgi:hypothetical protein